MRWLRRWWAAWWDRPSTGPNVAEDGGSWLPYDELISAARSEDPALDARLRQSAERIRQHEEPDED